MLVAAEVPTEKGLDVPSLWVAFFPRLGSCSLSLCNLNLLITTIRFAVARRREVKLEKLEKLLVLRPLRACVLLDHIGLEETPLAPMTELLSGCSESVVSLTSSI